MSIARTPPYIKATESAVDASEWRIIDGDEDLLVGDSLPQWDPGTNLRFIRDVDVDVERIRAECGLPADCNVRVAVSWHCEGTTLRGRGSVIDLTGSAPAVTLEMAVEGQDLSGKLVLRTAVVLATRLKPAPLRARRLGSVLWEDEQIVALEGEGSRFPTEVVSFEDSGWQLPARAAWALDWNREDLDVPVLGGIRLYLNSDHAQVLSMLQSPRDPASLVFIAAMHQDVGRQLIRGAVLTEEFRDREQYPRDSIGHVIQRLIKARFKGENPTSLHNRLHQRPEQFDALLQDRLRAFGSN
jgi:hypothetical protein